MIDLLQGSVLCGALIGAAVWVLVSILAPYVSASASLPPATRERVARALLYAPFWVPLAVIGASLAPGMIGALLTVGESCSTHGIASHHHLCSSHQTHGAGWLIALIVIAPAVWVVTACASRGWTEWNLARTLNAISRPSDFGPDVRLLDRPEPVALTVGWRNPTILLSTGLVAELSQSSLDVVIAHERAHIDRKDTWYALADRLAAGLLPRSAGRALTAQILAAREEACDAMAASQTGGNQAVADVLDEVLRIRSAPALSDSLDSASVADRIERLLRPPPQRRLAWASPLTFFILGLALGVGPLHAAAETVVQLLLH